MGKNLYEGFKDLQNKVCKVKDLWNQNFVESRIYGIKESMVTNSYSIPIWN